MVKNYCLIDYSKKYYRSKHQLMNVVFPNELTTREKISKNIFWFCWKNWSNEIKVKFSGLSSYQRNYTLREGEEREKREEREIL